MFCKKVYINLKSHGSILEAFVFSFDDTCLHNANKTFVSNFMFSPHVTAVVGKRINLKGQQQFILSLDNTGAGCFLPIKKESS